MKKLILALLILFPLVSLAQNHIYIFNSRRNYNFGFDSSYRYYKAITIDHTKVQADQVSFPIDYDVTDPSLRFILNGGRLLNGSGYDVAFFSNSDCVTGKLNSGLELYNGTTGQWTGWVNIPSISSTVDTVIYMCYGNNGIGPNQTSTAVWDPNFQAVYHLPNGTTLTANDSTFDAFNGTLVNTPTAANGQIDGAGSFVRASGQAISIGTTAMLKAVQGSTLSAWVKPTTSASPSRKVVIGVSSGTSSTGNRATIYLDDTGQGIITCGGRAGDAETFQSVASTKAVASGKWIYISCVFDLPNDTITMYTDGIATSTTGTVNFTAGVTSNTSSLSTNLANLNATGNMDGLIDEARISTSTRSSTWIKTEYNNQFSTSTFYTIGTENPLTSTYVFKYIFQ